MQHDFELVKGQNSAHVEKISQVTSELQSQLQLLQVKLVKTEDEMRFKIHQLENDVEKSQQVNNTVFGKLIGHCDENWFFYLHRDRNSMQN